MGSWQPSAGRSLETVAGTDRPGLETVEAPPLRSAVADRLKSAVTSAGGSESMDDFPAAFLSPSPEDEDEGDLDIDLDAMETPSDSESLLFPALELEALGQEDVVDKEGSRWRCFCPGEPPQEAWVNMSVLEPFLRVLSHGGYHGDGMNDVIVFSSCFLPENSLENYQYVMDNLFRLRKNLKGFYVVHPTWYIKALITIIKPFIRSAPLQSHTPFCASSPPPPPPPAPQLQVQQEAALCGDPAGAGGAGAPGAAAGPRLRPP
ncbi:unnamed protein product, partial [Tetraodon nigroviridis]